MDHSKSVRNANLGPSQGLSPRTVDDPRVVRHVEAYGAELERGDNPDRQELIEQFPEIAEELAACLDGLEFVHQVMPQLQQADASEDATTPGRLHPLAALGDFRILREIGRGGMGVVYEAEQLSLGRRVALKVLPFAAVLDQRQLQRFKNEAQAAAALNHPNIVGVHSVGCERAVHFYAMQYVEGQTLAQVIDELRLLAGPDGRGKDSGSFSRLVRDLTSGRVPAPSKTGADATTAEPPLSAPGCASATTETQRQPRAAISTEGSVRSPEFFRSVANLGIQAAEALEHAHGIGVVHRDIKPSNLLVDEGGHLWITDFGLAMSQASTNLTMTGDVLGTLRYMSPEQLQAKRGVLDHRTDIYSLGITLYEILTLKPAFAGGDRQQLMRQIMEEDPRAPRQANETIPKDLETIVIRAAAKEPQSRYATAVELADDLRRFIEDKPIRARRPSVAERAVRWSRRHQSIVWAALTVSAIAVVALSLSTILITRAYNVAETERARAEENLRAILSGVEDPTDPVSTQGDFHKTIALWDTFVRLNPDSAKCLRGRGYAYVHYGYLKKGIADLTEAIRLKPTYAVVYNWRAYSYWQMGQVDKAMEDCAEGIRLNPNNGGAYAWRGYMYCQEGDPGRAIDDLDEALRISPKHTGYYCWRALAYAEMGRRQDALLDLDRTSQLWPHTFLNVTFVAWFLATNPDPQLRRPNRAVELVEEAVLQRPRAGHLWLYLGIGHYHQGEFQKAIDDIEKSNELPMPPHRRAAARFVLAMAHWQLGNTRQARRWYDQAVACMGDQDSWTYREKEFDQFREEAAELLGIPDTSRVPKESQSHLRPDVD